MNELFTPRIEGVSVSSPSFDFHAHRIARTVLEAEETTKRVETQREVEVEVTADDLRKENNPPLLDTLA